MKANLTALYVDRLAPPAQTQVDIYDASMPGLVLRVSPSGRKVWCVVYRHQGRNRRLTLGRYPIMGLADARQRARKHLLAAADGGDPAGAKRQQRSADTFATLAPRYLERWAKVRKRTWKEDRRCIGTDLLPAWGSRKIGDIGRGDVRALIEGVAARGAPVQANRTLACISAIFSFAVREELLTVNPAFRISRPGVETKRERVLAEDEIRAIWTTAESMAPPAFGIVVKLGLLLGQRRGEINGMRWNELDLSGGWWNLPGERTKNKLATRVPLVGTALQILRERRANSEPSEPLIFPERYTFDQRIQSLKAAAVIENFTFHDLRRTATSLLASLRVERTVVKKILNHIEGRDITNVYDRYGYDREKVEALAKLDRRLREIVTGAAASKVVSINASA